MLVKNTKAFINANGHQIDLSWQNPSVAEFEEFAGIKVVRRERRFPLDENDGELRFVGDSAVTSFSDSLVAVARLEELAVEIPASLRGKVRYQADQKLLIFEGRMSNSERDQLLDLPANAEFSNAIQALYTRSQAAPKAQSVYYYTIFTFDTATPPQHFGGRQSRVAAMASSNYASAKQLYAMLPSIYHRFDAKGELRRFLEIFGPEFDLIRSFAAAARDLQDLDRTASAYLPLLAQWIGWQLNPHHEIDTQRNELYYAPHYYRTIGLIPNLLALINRLTTWDCQIKEFFHNVLRTNTPPSLALWTQEKKASGWQTSAPLVLDTAFEGAPAILRTADDTVWLFYHAQRDESSHMWCKKHSEGQWQPAQPLTQGKGVHKYPAAVQTSDGTIHLFWSELRQDPETKKDIWQLESAAWNQNGWSEPVTILGANDSSDFEPAVVAEPGSDNALWLFWSSQRSGRWHIWHSRFDGDSWAEAKQLTQGETSDRKPVAIYFAPALANARLWVIWSRQTQNGRRLFYATKPDLDFAADNWSAPQELPASSPTDAYFDDSEPFALINPAGDLEVYWHSNRIGTNKIWLRTLIQADGVWQAEEQISRDEGVCQSPAALYFPDGRLLLCYRSDRPISYTSKFYPSARTVDQHYAGAMTFEPRNLERHHRRGRFEDDQTYLSDTGKSESDWYARDTIGIYLTPDTENQQVIRRFQQNLQIILRRFLPLQLRAVVIINPAVYKEYVYTYDFPQVVPQRFIEETYAGTPTDVELENFGSYADSYTDVAQNWQWLRTWSEASPASRLVDTGATPMDLRFRIFHRAIKEGNPPG